MHQGRDRQISRRAFARGIGGAVAACTITIGQRRGAVFAARQAAPASAADEWAALLRRPLRFSTLAAGQPCPRTECHHLIMRDAGWPLGAGPVYVGMSFIGAENLDMQRPSATGWYSMKGLWWGAPGSAGRPILVRGRRLDGAGELRFSRGPEEPTADLQLGAQGPLALVASWEDWATNLWVRAPGCYACQVDGADFSERIVIEAVGKQPDELTAVPPFKPGNRRGELQIAAAVPLDHDTVRLALYGLGLLAVQLDVTPTRSGPLQLSGQNVQRARYSRGTVIWTPFAGMTMPQFAAWDDGRFRYRLQALEGVEPGYWTTEDLLNLIEAFATAPGIKATPPPAG